MRCICAADTSKWHQDTPQKRYLQRNFVFLSTFEMPIIANLWIKLPSIERDVIICIDHPLPTNTDTNTHTLPSTKSITSLDFVAQ